MRESRREVHRSVYTQKGVVREEAAAVVCARWAQGKWPSVHKRRWKVASGFCPEEAAWHDILPVPWEGSHEIDCDRIAAVVGDWQGVKESDRYCRLGLVALGKAQRSQQ